MSFPAVVESAPKEVSLSQVVCSFFGSQGEQDVEDGTRILELEGRKISSGFCDNGDGQLRSLVVETVGGEREVAGEHKPDGNDRNLIESPPSVEPPLQLSHLSGDERENNWSVVFHYE